MIVTLYADSYISEVHLPEICRGQFWIRKNGEKTVEIEGRENKWYLRLNGEICLLDSESEEILLQENTAIEIYEKTQKRKGLVVTKSEDDSYKISRT